MPYSTADDAATMRCPVCQGTGTVNGQACPLCGGGRRVTHAVFARYQGANTLQTTVCPACAGSGRTFNNGVYQTCSLCGGSRQVPTATAQTWSDAT